MNPQLVIFGILGILKMLCDFDLKKILKCRFLCSQDAKNIKQKHKKEVFFLKKEPAEIYVKLRDLMNSLAFGIWSYQQR